MSFAERLRALLRDFELTLRLRALLRLVTQSFAERLVLQHAASTLHNNNNTTRFGTALWQHTAATLVREQLMTVADELTSCELV